ncbi:hypothetical protein CEXT_206741 [Caerostris extrusa]|uniref:Uncharacterized protein n=1 Tax=Caerostris extrusa TaxID=172846 RepID=A0AAV4RBZ8_CAEEX|nr:hypothetical protein CEXT_206741 [Caerostris extrusa]
MGEDLAIVITATAHKESFQIFPIFFAPPNFPPPPPSFLSNEPPFSCAGRQTGRTKCVCLTKLASPYPLPPSPTHSS